MYMSCLNKPDRISCDAFSDSNLKYNNTGGNYTSFNNVLQQPLLNVRGLQLIRANFVNPVLQLNDNNQLMFFYYTAAASSGIVNANNLKVVRLYPSDFVPAVGFTDYTTNKYFNTVAELVVALNAAASANGDNITYNPKFLADDIEFSYDPDTRRISVEGLTAGNYYSVAAFDDPNVIAYLKTNAITMNGYGGVVVQKYSLNTTMNPRLGFSQGYFNKGSWWGSSSQLGVATLTGVPQLNAVPILANNTPILIGSQNINVYLNSLGATGQDSRNKKNLLATIPLEFGALFVNSYTLTSLEQPAHIVNGEIYNMTFSFEDDYGNEVTMLGNYNTNLELNVFYNY